MGRDGRAMSQYALAIVSKGGKGMAFLVFPGRWRRKKGVLPEAGKSQQGSRKALVSGERTPV